MQQIVRFQLLDWPVERIALQLGMTPDGISTLIGLPRYAEIRAEAVGRAFAGVDTAIQQRKVNVMLEDKAPDAMEALQDLLELARPRRDEEGRLTAAGCDPETTRLTAFGLLDRAGYGPVQRKAIRQRLELDPMLVAIFQQALHEAQPRVVNVTPAKDEPSGDQA